MPSSAEYMCYEPSLKPLWHLQTDADGKKAEPLSVAATGFGVAEFSLDMETGASSKRDLAPGASGEYPKIPAHLQGARCFKI